MQLIMQLQRARILLSIKFSFVNKKKSFINYLKTLEYVNDENIDAVFNFYKHNNKKILNENFNRILIKGEVQSGKTNNIIYLISELQIKCNYFIYLSGHLNDLNDQNQRRIESAMNIISDNFLSINMNNKNIDANAVKRNSQDKKLLFFGIKRREYLINIVSSIKQNDKNAKIIIFDDESDSYTISQSNIELRKKICEEFLSIKYISITATPYINLFHFSDLYDSYYVYNSHEKYTGLNKFISQYKLDSNRGIKNILQNLILHTFKAGGGSII